MAMFVAWVMCCMSCVVGASWWNAADSWQHNKLFDRELVYAGH